MSSRRDSVKRLFGRSLVLLLWTVALCYGIQSSSGQTTFAQNEASIQAPSQQFHPGLMRVDFAITTVSPTVWNGEISLSRGAFSDMVPLGVSATSGTDFFFSDLSQNCLTLHTCSPVTFCGVETTIIAPRDSRLDLKLHDVTNNRLCSKTIHVDRLIDSSTSIKLDDQGSSVQITRAPADELPVFVRKLSSNDGLDSPSLFRPNETLSVTVIPRSSSKKLSNDLSLVATAKLIGTDVPFWTDSCELPLSQIQQNDVASCDPVGRFTPCNFSVTTPNKPGVFELVVELYSKTAGVSSRISLPLRNSHKSNTEGVLIARRVVQGVVLQDSTTQEESETSIDKPSGDLRGDLLEIVDPTNPSWRKTFSKRNSLPFRKFSANEQFPLGQMENAVPSTFANEENEAYPNAPFQSVSESSQTFANEASSVSCMESSQNNVPEPLNAATVATPINPSTGLVLGQEAPSKSSPIPSFNMSMNLFGLGKADPSKSNAEQADVQERLEFIRRWERDEFHSFLYTLDQRNWTLTEDLWEKPLSSGSSRVFDASELKQFAPPQTNFVRLAPNGASHNVSEANNKTLAKLVDQGIRYDSVSWEAYPIPIQEPGKPHLLEIEYPTNFPQKLGVSVLEPSFSGALLPSANDAGIIVDDNPLSDRSAKEVSRYTLLFWPRTKTPIVLLSNCSSTTAAAYGQIRIYRANSVEETTATPNRGRVFGLALSRPNICEQFSAELKPSFFGLSGVEDWQSFDDSISRILYYLSAYNYDVTTLAVVADGSSLYPSKLVNPTPKYDGGVFLTSGGDQNKKDVLSLAMNKFEAQGKSLIPMIKLNSTLPGIESRLSLLRMNALSESERASLEGAEWIGVDSHRLIDDRRQANGSGPYYNVLHPVVEREVLAIVRELVSRCAPYNSFGGLALDVGSNGWLALPDDVYYGMDDETIARFVRESNLQDVLVNKSDRRVQELLLAKGPERYRQRAEFIRDVCFNEWINWRVDALYRFYRKVRETAASVRSDVRLYLVATDALDGPCCQATLYPSLNSASRLQEALRLVGLDPTRFATVPAQKESSGNVSQVGFVSGPISGENFDTTIVLLRPETVALTTPFAKTAIKDELATPEAISLFSANQAFPGVVFLHESEKRKLYDFDLTSPYRPSVVELNTRALPANFENRKRFARSLAINDNLCFFDGGDTIPFGQEESLRDWIYVFKSLPAVPFRTWTPSAESSEKNNLTSKEQEEVASNSDTAEKSIQPIVVRYYRNSKETWVYLLNVASFHSNVKITLTRKSNASYETFVGFRNEEPIPVKDSLVWNFTAMPYDLVALRVADPRATIETVEVTKPTEICGNNGRMQQSVRDFVDRIVAAQKGLELPLRNGGFEESFEPGSGVDANAQDSKQGKANLLGLEMPQMNLFSKNNKTDAPSDVHSSGNNLNDKTIDPTQIPGWRAFGPNDVDVRLDTKIRKDGRASLRIASNNNVGGVVCQPFASPTTGRLCAQISFGVPQNVRQLPLNVCLTGRRNGTPFNRRISVESTILKKVRNPNVEVSDDGIVWLKEVVLFDRLPLDGLEDLSLRFELCGKGEIWLDQIGLYRLAFANTEQSILMKLINTAEYRASKERVVDVMFMLDSYWARLLKDQIPNDSPILATRTRTPETVSSLPQESPTQTDENKGDEEKESKGWSRFKLW